MTSFSFTIKEVQRKLNYLNDDLQRYERWLEERALIDIALGCHMQRITNQEALKNFKRVQESNKRMIDHYREELTSKMGEKQLLESMLAQLPESEEVA